MSLIILSGLGTGAYREATYQAEGYTETIKTGLFTTALKSWYPEATVKILATEAAWSKENGQHVREHHPDFERIRIPDGRTEAEAWEIFQAVADAVPRGSTVIFDITHGLRSLPMLGFLVLSYLQVVKDVQIEKVCYGALELTPRQEGALTPVVDLTPLVKLLDWAQAAKRFQDTGDASQFKSLLEVSHRADYNGVSRQLEVLSKAIFSNRGLSIPSEAAKLIRVMKIAQEGQFEIHQRPFSLVMQQLEKQVAPLALEEQDDKLKLQAEYALICWYAERGHYPQAMSLAREWLISVRQWYQLGRICMNETEREGINADIALSAKLRRKKSLDYFNNMSPEMQILCNVGEKLGQLRNDLMHFGFKPAPRGTEKLKNEADKVIASLPAAVKPLGLELEPPNTPAP